jgi:hypothetical protein
MLIDAIDLRRLHVIRAHHPMPPCQHPCNRCAHEATHTPWRELLGKRCQD